MTSFLASQNNLLEEIKKNMQEQSASQIENLVAIVSYEILDGKDEYVTSYSADLKKNTNGRLDGLKMARDTLRYRADYRLYEVYSNGYRKLID
jgi:hypothetical protein